PGPGPAGQGELVDDPEQGRLAVADGVSVDGGGGQGQDAGAEDDPDGVAGMAAVAGPGQPGHQAARSASRVAVAAVSSAGPGSRAGTPSSSRTRAPTATPRAVPPTMSRGRWAPTYMRVKNT